MPAYTLAQLIDAAKQKGCPYMPNDKTLAKVNTFIATVESGDKIKPGDIVMVQAKSSYAPMNLVKGELYRWRATNPSDKPGRFTVCGQYFGAYIPFVVDPKKGTLSLSGGPWESVDLKRLKLTGRQPASFYEWCWSPEANGAVPFYANVRVWQTDEEL